MSAHVLLNLLNEMGKSDKMLCLPSILSLFPNKFNKFNNIGARMLDSIYRMPSKLLEKRILGMKTKLRPFICSVIMDVITLRKNL